MGSYNRSRSLRPLVITWSFLFLWFLAPSFSGRFTWGFDHLKYYSPSFRVFWLFTGIAAAGWSSIRGWPSSLGDVFRKKWALVVLVPLFTVFYTLFQTSAPLLGDGFLRAKEVMLGRVFSLTEPLTSLVHGLSYQLALKKGLAPDPSSAILVYRWISIVAGTTAVAIFWVMSKNQEKGQSLPLFLILSFLGLNQIFYGYVESYALFIVATFCFLWAGAEEVNVQDRVGSRLATVLFLILAVSLHSAGVFLLPPFLFWWWVKRRLGVRQNMATGVLLLLPVGLVIIGILLAGQKSLSYFINELPRHPHLQLWDGWLGYGILSPGHWLDIINQLMLVAPVSIFLAVSSGPRGWVVAGDKKKIFLLIAAASALLFLLITDPKLGVARDWDLFAWTGIPAVLLTYTCSRPKEDYGNRLPLAAVLSFWLFVPWIGINSSGPRSEARYIDILKRDQRSAAYGFENLAIHYHRLQRPIEREWAYQQAYLADSSNPRHIFNYAWALSKNGKYLESLSYYETSLRLDSQRDKRWNDYGVALLQLNRPGPALQAFNKALELDPENCMAYYNAGLAYSMLGEWAQADLCFHYAWRKGYERNDPWFCLYWGKAKLRMEEFSAATELLGKAIEGGVNDTLAIREYQQALSASGKLK